MVPPPSAGASVGGPPVRRVQLLGDVSVDGAPVAGARLRSLLVALLLVPGRIRSTSSLVDAVWDGDAPDDPAGALQALVSRVRRTTGLAVDAVAGGYRVAAASVVVDTAQLHDVPVRARRALAAGDPATAAALARDGLDASRAPGAHLPPADAARVEEVRRELLVVRATAALVPTADPGERADVLAWLEEAGAGPVPDEPLAALHVRLLVAAGRPARALDRYERVRAALAEYGSDPSAPLRSAHAEALAASVDTAPRPAPAARPLPGAAAGPRVREALLGRDDDLAALAARVRDHVLVTLVGPGGVGKTTLISALAASWREAGEPVHEVALAGVRAAPDVVPAVVAALGGGRRRDLAAPEGPLDPVAELRRVVAASRGLLVLDNCEHLLDAVADVVLHVCAAAPPGLRVVATSRAPLGVLGERVQPLRPLAGAASAELVRRRADAVRPGAELSADAVTELCERLDHLPLALELAAARLRTTTLPALLTALDDRFAALADGPRGLPARHRSLTALVDWSWDLLPEAERLLLRRLAVFPGGAGASAITSVCAGDGLPATAVPAALAGLVDASLVVLDDAGAAGDPDDPDGHGCYRLLETVREYAESRAAAGELEGAVDRLVAWAAGVAREVVADLPGPGQVAALRRFGREHDALALALRRSLRAGDVARATPLGAALVLGSVLRGLHAETGEWVVALAAGPCVLDGDLPTDPARGAQLLPVLWREAALTAVLGAFTGAVTGGSRLLAVQVRRLRRAARRPELLDEGTAAAVDLVQVLAHDAEDGAREAVDRFATVRHPWWRGCGLLARAWWEENNGLGDLGLTAARSAHALLAGCGDVAGRGTAATAVAERLAALGQLEEALTWWADAEAAATTIGAESDARQARVLSLRARASLGGGDDAARAEVAQEVVALAAAHPQDQLLGVLSVALRAQAAQEAGDDDGARAAWAGAIAAASSQPAVIRQLVAVLLASAALVEVRAGDPLAAGALLRRAVDEAMAARDVPAQAMVGEVVAVWCAARGETATARALAAHAERFGSHLQHFLGGADLDELAELVRREPPPGAAGAPGERLEGRAAVARLRELLVGAVAGW